MQLGPLVVMFGTLWVVASAFLPWARSGRASRTSFELVGAVETLGVLDGPLAALATAWYLVPALGGAVVVAALARRPGVVIALGLLVAAAGAAFAVAVRISPLVPQAGTSATIVGAVVVAAGAAYGSTAGRTQRSQRR